MTTREDAFCPACPDPEKAFRIEDVGMKFDHDTSDDGWTIRATRPVWEPIMLAHVETQDDEQHQRLYERCMTALNGRSAEEVARDEVQSAVDSVRRTIGDALHPPFPSAFTVADRDGPPIVRAHLNRERPTR
jgi:hypothetical protein